MFIKRWLALLLTIIAQISWADDFCNSSECRYHVPLERSGAYIAIVTLSSEQNEGLWSLTINPNRSYPQYLNGFWAGSILKEKKEKTPSWVAFSLSQTTPINITPYDWIGDGSPLTIQIERGIGGGQRELVYGPTPMIQGQTYTTHTLSQGFYITNLLSQSDSMKIYQGLALEGQGIYGGVVGGYLDSSSGVGYSAFIIRSPQTIEFLLSYGDSFGNLGASLPHLDIFYEYPNGTRELFWSAPATTLIEPPELNIDPFEFNDNPTDATPISTYPVQATATIQADVDGDYYRFAGKKGDVITAVLTKTAPNFQPRLSIANELGISLSNVSINISDKSPFSTVFTTKLSSDGDYLLVVNDANSKGSPDFIYTVNLFKDMDFDGLDDNMELEQGINNQTPDSDKDGIFDAAETNGNSDIDGDTIPNWYDLDSDNDGIQDRLEGSADTDGDGLGHFIDTDSDNNGILDSQEVGLNPQQPIDSDVDSLPDYQDTDDDNDGILDINDTDRLIRVNQSNALDFENRVFLESASVDFGSNNTLKNSARAGDTLLLKGDGFSTTVADNLVIFRNNHTSVNVFPIAATETELHVLVPEGAGSRISVVTRNQQSNGLDIQILTKNTPALFEWDIAKTVRIGETLTLTGLNFTGSINANFGGVQATAYNVTSNTLDVTVPTNAVSGKVTVSNASGESNAVTLEVTTGVSGQIELPTGSSVDITQLMVTFGPLGNEVAPDTNGNFSVPLNNSEMDIIDVYLPETSEYLPALYSQAVSLPGDTSIKVDVFSTAVALTMMRANTETYVEPSELALARDLISQLPEVIEFANTLSQLLVEEPYFRSNFSSPRQDLYYEALFKAIEAAQSVINSPSLRRKKATRSSLDEPQITPEEQNDIKIIQVGNTGNVGVENDTQLYLSATFIDSNIGKPLVNHVTGYGDSQMVGPQGGFYSLFWANQKEDYNQPKWRNIEIQIITPGIKSGQIAANRQVKLYLLWRTTMDRVFNPVLDEVIGLTFDPNFFAKLLMKYQSKVIIEFEAHLFDGNVGKAFLSIAGVMWQEVSGCVTALIPGNENFINWKGKCEFLKALLVKKISKAKDDAIEEILKRFGGKLAENANFIIKAINTGITGTEVAKAILDISTIPETVVFTVEWPLQITSIKPNVVKKDTNDIRIGINGQGFAPIDKSYWQSDLLGKEWVYPEVTLTDEGGGAGSITMKYEQFYAADATRIFIDMPGDFRFNATGPISVKVAHDGAEASSPEKIRVTSGVEISTINPDSRGLLGSLIDVVGAGFSSNLLDNAVTFIKETGESLNGTIAAASESALTVMVPPELALSKEVQVQVDVNGESSNSQTFTQITNEVIFDFGDNGSANDDTFALFVDGVLIHSMPSPTRHAGPMSLHLAEGQHSVMLRGITAPDDIGTYFINVLGNVIDIIGDPQTGIDLTAGRQKHYVIEVGTAETRRVNVFSVPEGILWEE